VAEDLRRNRLSVRTRRLRGPVEEFVRLDGSWTDLNGPRLVILVHGFNNTEMRAEDSYASMIKGLKECLPSGRVARLDPVWEFYWPGDQARSRLPLAMIRGYRASLKETERVAELLADWLARRPRRQSVSIVAHSMGCRITLEVTRRAQELDPYPGARIRHIFLLAAAVPVNQCALGDPRASAYSRPLRGCAERVFYSRSDWVLRCSFPLGQPLMSAERGPAVGLTGGPTLRWKSRQPTGLGHTKYWENPRVAEEICSRLGIPTIRKQPTNPLPESKVEKISIETKKLAGKALPRRLL
jgi:pimeloyl-ACP methyl ester carboxylesterase